MKTSNPFLAVMRCRYHTGMNAGESRLRHFSRRCKMLLSVLVITLSSTMWAASPVIVEGDIITVSGGTVSPDNPDVYVIDMGNYTNGTTYSITLNRPKGSQANYPVSIKYSWQNNDYDRGIWQSCFYADKETGEYLSDGVFEFAAGETTKTITFDANDSAKLPNSQAVVYLFFGQGSRTRAEYPVVKMNFTNPQPVTPTTGSEYPDNSPSVYTSMMFPVGYYMLMYMDGDYFGHFDVLNNTRLRINRQYLNHEANPVNISDRQLAQSQSLLLKPEQPEGAVTNILEFIYKVTEDAIISDYERTQDGDMLPPTPSFTRQADSVMNLQMAKDKTLFGKLGVDDSNYGMGDAMPVIMDDYQYMELPPRFGAITADATTYDWGATISLTVPVLNSKLMQKVYPDNRWMENVKITLDGGESFVDPSYISFDGASGTITAITEAKNETGSSVQVTAEVLLRDTRRMESRMSAGWSARDSVMNVKKRAVVRMEDDNGDKYWYIYGANTAFTVTTQQASFRAVESISFTLPKDNQININATNVNLLAKVNPVTATFKSGTWSSSNPAVAELSADGILLPKEYGKTTITFTSDEVGYRAAKNLPENNATLIQSFDMYVVGEQGKFVHYTAVYTGYSMELYRNGHLSNFKPLTGSIRTTTKNLTIARKDDATTDWSLRGTVDEVRIYNTELSQNLLGKLPSTFTLLSNVDNVSVKKISVYPNPFIDVINVELRPNEKIESISVYDMPGRLIYNYIGEQPIINLTSLKNGVYILDIQTNKGKYKIKAMKRN